MLPIISAEERLKERHSAKIALVGAPGVGKTSQLRTLPADTTLFVDLEAGDLSVRDWPGDTVRPRTWPEFRDLVVFLAGPMPTASADQAFSQAHFEHVCTKFGDPAQLARYDTYAAAIQLPSAMRSVCAASRTLARSGPSRLLSNGSMGPMSAISVRLTAS